MMYKIIHYVLGEKNIPKTLEFFKASKRVQAGASHLNLVEIMVLLLVLKI